MGDIPWRAPNALMMGPPCEHKQTKIWEPHLAGARKCIDCGMVYNPNCAQRWFIEQVPREFWIKSTYDFISIEPRDVLEAERPKFNETLDVCERFANGQATEAERAAARATQRDKLIEMILAEGLERKKK